VRTSAWKILANTKHRTIVIAIGCSSDHPIPIIERRYLARKSLRTSASQK
jgi:DNA repair photolyase